MSAKVHKVCDVCAWSGVTSKKDCPSCWTPFPKPGQISAHTGEVVRGAPASTRRRGSGRHKLYVLSVRMTKGEPHIWDQRFAFHASDDDDAKKLADGWARYQGMTSSEVGLTPVKSESDLPYSEDFIHDDWVMRA